MSEKIFPYFVEAIYADEDKPKKILDVEEPGWADPENLEGVIHWSLVPKAQGPYPLVKINIPEGGKPVFKSRVFNSTLGVHFRIYGIGWHKGGHTEWTWVMPEGKAIENGEEPDIPAMILSMMNQQILAQGVRE